MKYLYPLFITFLLATHFAAAQDLELDRDTIRVSQSLGAIITFPGEIENVAPTCSDYNLHFDDNHLTVKRTVSNPVPYCLFFVYEGPKSSQRTHKLVIAFTKDAQGLEQYYDFSTKEKLAARVAALSASRKATSALPSIVKNKPALVEDAPVEAAALRKVYTPAEAIAADATMVEGIPYDLIKKRVLVTIDAFYRVCERLARNYNLPHDMNYGMGLFNNNDTVSVQTTSKKGPNKPQKIRQYFRHLTQLPYQKIRMTNSQVLYVSNFYPGTDGQWHATCKVAQNFQGFKDGNILAYQDKTDKGFEIILKIYQDEEGGKVIKRFNIFLGNISIESVN